VLDISSLAIPDVKVIRPAKFGDQRGFFSETYNQRAFREAGIDTVFVQDNHAFSAKTGTLRGLHFQAPPFAQTKLVRVAKGRIWDVAVDIRQGSRSFGRWVAAEISADGWEQILIPAGFAHGYCTLEPDTEIIYKVDNYYSPSHDLGVSWDDADISIAWPLSIDDNVLSEKDRNLPRLNELQSPFLYDAA